MASGTDYAQSYQAAEKAYMQGSYETAAATIDSLAKEYPTDPSVLLLKGHIYCYGLHQYEVAQQQYKSVLHLSSDPEFVDYANNGLAYAAQSVDDSAEALSPMPDEFDDGLSEAADSFNAADKVDSLGDRNDEEVAAWSGSTETEAPDEDLDAFIDFSVADFAADFAADGSMTSASQASGAEADNPFGLSVGASSNASSTPFAEDDDDNPFAGDSFITEDLGLEDPPLAATLEDEPFEFEGAGSDGADFDGADFDGADFDAENAAEGGVTTFSDASADFDLAEFDEAFGTSGSVANQAQANSQIASSTDRSTHEPLGSSGVRSLKSQQIRSQQIKSQQIKSQQIKSQQNSVSDDLDEFPDDSEAFDGLSFEPHSESNFEADAEDKTFFMMEPEISQGNSALGEPSTSATLAEISFLDSDSSQLNFDKSDASSAGSASAGGFGAAGFGASGFGSNNFEANDFEANDFEANSFESDASEHTSEPTSFGDAFDDFDDFESIPDFDLSDSSAGFTSPSIGAMPSQFGSGMSAGDASLGGSSGHSSLGHSSLGHSNSFAASESPPLPVFNKKALSNPKPQKQGSLAPLENASMPTKQLILAGTAGVLSAMTITAMGFGMATPGQSKASPLATGGVAGLISLGSVLGLGYLLERRTRQTVNDLQVCFNQISRGDLNARATIFTRDEFGQLSEGFNQMASAIFTTTNEAQRKAQEQEQAKEDLQRQVIRLLDDVEGAARGDLTVKAEVTADVLGAVADSFNLTIENLREIVIQVSVAARQVSQGSTENEAFARALSADALRQAEELAVTLNSVQVMTDSIQRVAESAREAEEVARSASETALRGGEAVERTVAGILDIRETVADTTRKVKRLAESSQEISKIVALISQIASRTNLLALNASIEAARAGEAGRGFAIVADEVRQLADRAAKASKEIEQIVLQIQSETGGVMTAMEEGTQQVIEGTRLAEQAKQSLDDIIQVSNRIDVLVRSITADTVEQTETSRAVAQVMQSVELTAQETSQESQRVSGSLQNLVGVAKDLLTSVDKFKVNKKKS